MPYSTAIFDCYGKLVAFVDARDIPITHGEITPPGSPSPCVVKPVGGCPPVTAGRQLFQEEDAA